MLGYTATTSCRMDYLLRELDDPAAAPCGRCDNCTGISRAASVSTASETLARGRLQRPGVPVTPRRMWPSGVKDLGVGAAGKISAGDAAETGRSVGRLTDLGWGATLRTVLTGDAPDEPVPDELFGAVVQVLTGWDWAQRPAV